MRDIHLLDSCKCAHEKVLLFFLLLKIKLICLNLPPNDPAGGLKAKALKPI